MTPATNAIIERARQIKEQAEKIDTSRTEIVRMDDLRVGDVVLAVGPADTGKRFPFPFTLSGARVIHSVVILTATHGWFNVKPYPKDDPALIVARHR